MLVLKDIKIQSILCILYVIFINIFFIMLYINIKIVLYGLIIILISIIPAAYISLSERQIVGIIQQRFGPNLWGGIFSLINPLLDGLKLFMRKWVILKNSKNTKYILFMFAYTLSISIGIWVLLYIKDNFYSIWVILMLLTINNYGIFIGGMFYQNKYIKLSILRLIALIISYDLIIGIIFLIPTMLGNSLSIYGIWQNQLFYGSIFFISLPWFILYYTLLLSEGKKVPFDTIESEPELASGYMQEMSGIAFALLVISEYIWLFFLLVLWDILFFYNFNFIIIIAILIILFLILRTMLPNYRFDQIINIFWKYIFPLSLLFFTITLFFLI